MANGWALAIDFGTSRSAGAMSDDGGISSLEVEGNRWMPSMVLLDTDGSLLVGVAADNQAAIYPERVERTPKRHLGTRAPLLLGQQEVEVTDAVATVLRVFLAEGKLRRNSVDPAVAVLTHPVRWGSERTGELVKAAEAAGFPEVVLVEEPVAAAAHYATDQIEVGQYVGVYDLGGGTFDSAVLQRTADSFETIGSPGGDEFIGGEDFDHKLFNYFGRTLAEDDPEMWELMLTSEERKWKRAALDLLVQARKAKESLSSYSQAQVFVPVADRDIVITRSQFEEMVIEEVERTVDVMDDTIADAGLRTEDLAAVYLVGGSSRIPLVVRLVTERFGDRVATRDEPKGVVALGAARVGLHHLEQRSSPPTLLPPPLGTGVPGAPQTPFPGAPPVPPPPPGTGGTLAPPPPPGPGTPMSPGVASPPPPPPGTGLPATPTGATPRVPLPPPPTTGSAPTPAIPQAQPQPQPHVDPMPPLQVDRSRTVDAAVAWRVALPGVPAPATSDGPTVFFGTSDGQVHAVETATGTRRWAVQLGGAITSRPFLLAGRVHVGTADGLVSCLDVRNGGAYWQVPTLAPITAPVVVTGGVVVAANQAGAVSAIDGPRGALRWTLPLPAPVVAQPVPVLGAVLVACTDHRLYSVDLLNGRVRWAYQTGGPLTGSPVSADGLAVVPSADGLIYALDLRTGRPRWGFRTGGANTTDAHLLGPTVVVASTDGAVYSIDRASGRCLWRWDAGLTPSSTGVLVDRDRLYVDTGSGDHLSVDLPRRTVVWRFATGATALARPTPLGRVVLLPTTAEPSLTAVQA